MTNAFFSPYNEGVVNRGLLLATILKPQAIFLLYFSICSLWNFVFPLIGYNDSSKWSNRPLSYIEKMPPCKVKYKGLRAALPTHWSIDVDCWFIVIRCMGHSVHSAWRDCGWYVFNGHGSHTCSSALRLNPGPQLPNHITVLFN